MRAVTVVPGTPHSLALRDDAPEPAAGDGRALVRVLETGVCGTDVEIDDAQFGEAPPGSPYLILGHENLGRVERSPDGSGLASGRPRGGDGAASLPPAAAAPASRTSRTCASPASYLERGIKGLHGFMCDRYAESPALPDPSSRAARRRGRPRRAAERHREGRSSRPCASSSAWNGIRARRSCSGRGRSVSWPPRPAPARPRGHAGLARRPRLPRPRAWPRRWASVTSARRRPRSISSRR